MEERIKWTSIDEVVNKMRWKIEPWMYSVHWCDGEFYNRKYSGSRDFYREMIINNPADLFKDFMERFDHLLRAYSLEIDANIDKTSWDIKIELSREEEVEEKGKWYEYVISF